MCQANVYLDDQEIIRDVIWLEPTADGFLMRTLFGEPMEVVGTLKGIDLLKHRVLLSSTNQPQEKAER